MAVQILAVVWQYPMRNDALMLWGGKYRLREVNAGSLHLHSFIQSMATLVAKKTRVIFSIFTAHWWLVIKVNLLYIWLVCHPTTTVWVCSVTSTATAGRPEECAGIGQIA